MSPVTEPNAYTVGATQGYERYLDEDPAAGKGIGGIAYRTREEAQAVLDEHDGCLPPKWGYGDHNKATVYGLIMGKPFEMVTSRDPAVVRAAFHAWSCETGLDIPECTDCDKFVRLGPDGMLDYDALIEDVKLVRLG